MGRMTWKSSIITKMKKKLLPLTTPGEVLNEEFLIPLGISQYRLAKDIGIPPRRINEIVHGKRAITPNTALRMGKYFGVSAQFWLNLQTRYDLQKAEREADFLASIKHYSANSNTLALAA
jgi:antitoxin HigA-1